jgi:hypothetical protein
MCIWFNVFHVRALYYTKTLITNKRTKRVLSSIVTRSPTAHLWAPQMCSASRDHREFTPPKKQRSTQSTAHSRSTIKCNLSVTITKSSPWRWPGRVETCRSVLQLMIKLSLCICWWLVFLNLVDIVNSIRTLIYFSILLAQAKWIGTINSQLKTVLYGYFYLTQHKCKIYNLQGLF